MARWTGPGTTGAVARAVAAAVRRRDELAPLARALIAVPWVTFHLRRRGLAAAAPHHARPPRAAPREAAGDAVVAARARRLARVVAIASRHGLVAGTCLSRSLVLLDLMDREGIVGDLRIGVQSPARGFAAHAWVEHAGVVLNDGTDVHDRYAAFTGVVPRGLS